MTPQSIFLAVEDELSATLGELLLESVGGFRIINRMVTGGNTELKKKCKSFLDMAHNGLPVLIVTDLDKIDCPMALIESWFPHGLVRNLLFRVAIKEAESWLLADRDALSREFSVSKSRFPLLPDHEPDPKNLVIQLAKRSKKRDVQSIVPEQGSTATVGPEYNNFLCNFLRSKWNLHDATQNSQSLHRTVQRLQHYSAGRRT